LPRHSTIPPYSGEWIPGVLMLSALRYYWITAKGYRLRPWASPYLRWRLETYFGKDAAELDPAGFIRLLWRERAQMKRVLKWADELRRRRPLS
jgi:hypothetical protein